MEGVIYMIRTLEREKGSSGMRVVKQKEKVRVGG